jgi:hypothetical protein
MASDAVWQQESRGWHGRSSGPALGTDIDDVDPMAMLGYEAADPSLQLYLQSDPGETP